MVREELTCEEGMDIKMQLSMVFLIAMTRFFLQSIHYPSLTECVALAPSARSIIA